MNLFLTKLVSSGRRRIHIAVTESRPPSRVTRPLCGGGCGGRSVHWQQDIGPCDCAACAKIVQRSDPATPPEFSHTDSPITDYQI